MLRVRKVLLARHKGTDEIVAIKVLNKRALREKPNEIQRVMSGETECLCIRTLVPVLSDILYPVNLHRTLTE